MEIFKVLGNGDYRKTYDDTIDESKMVDKIAD